MRHHGFFERDSIFLWATGFACLLGLTTLWSGLFLDDYQQRITLLTGGGNVFEFFTMSTPVAQAQWQEGMLPWWHWPDSKTVFLRPLAQWSMALDYALWPDNFVLMHLHSALWYGATAAIAAFAYRELIPIRWSAGLAAVLFAIDYGHGGAVAWLANRNVMMCFSAGILALLCLRRSGAGWQAGGWLCFALALGAGESGLAIAGYLLAHEVFLARDALVRRALRLAPYALIALAWLAYRKMHGYGTAGPGFYIDPGEDLVYFLGEMLARVPAYLAGQWFIVPADVLGLAYATPARPVALGYALAVVALVGVLLAPLLRQSALARFFALGMVLAAIPISASTVVGRALWFVGFGALGLLALYLAQLHAAPARPGRFVRLVVALIVGVHLWLSPLLFVAYAKSLEYVDNMMDNRTVSLPTSDEQGRNLLVIGTKSYLQNITFPLLKARALSLGSTPESTAPTLQVHGLVSGAGTFRLARPDADTLLASAPEGFTHLRPQRYGFAAGDKAQPAYMSAEVLAVNTTAEPTAIAFRFPAGQLDRYRVLTWDKQGFVPAQLPPVGASADYRVE